MSRPEDGRTVEWLAPIMWAAMARAAVEHWPSPELRTPKPWAEATDGERAAIRETLTATLEALGDPCLLRLLEGEPIVVLRAGDTVAPFAFAGWMKLAVDEGLDLRSEKLGRARAKCDAMLDWQAAHPDWVKVPD